MKKRTSLVLASLFFASTAFADAPALIPIHGLLTDEQEVPLEGEVTLHLALYGSDTSSAALYTESQPVSVTAGGFSVYLGEAGALDLSLIRDRTELWLGLAVDADPELTPRVRLGTVPFAAFAQYCGDANTLEGASASDFAPVGHTHTPYTPGTGLALNGFQFSLVQSTVEGYARGVCIDTNAEAQAAMGARADTNPFNHDRYTDAEAVAAMGPIGNANPLNHNRYTNAEAVAAMGPLGDANTHNHNRYTDAEAVAAVAAADTYVLNTSDVMSGNLGVQGNLRLGTASGGSRIFQLGAGNCPANSVPLARNWTAATCVGTGACGSTCTTGSGWIVGATTPTCNYTFGDVGCFTGTCNAAAWTEIVCIGD